MPSKKIVPVATCGVTMCMQMLDSKWKPIILFQISKGANRFTKLLTVVEGINRQMLSKQLKSLEKLGILERSAFAEIPPRVEYTITPLGKSLLIVVQAMKRWGDKQTGVAEVKTKVDAKAATQQTALFD
ncbi:MAG: DNA-binding HxlR family transcriptional regulator [Maribacter sp.]|jgi:DNA-binding HxlR family transcriptional regulator